MTFSLLNEDNKKNLLQYVVIKSHFFFDKFHELSTRFGKVGRKPNKRLYGSGGVTRS
jgi:hypothetical protein